MFSEDLKAIGKAVVDMNNSNDTRALLDQHYAEDAVSVEALDMGGMGRETHGLKAIHGKHDWWESANETHSHSAEGPFFHGEDRFTVIFNADITDKSSGNRIQMREVGEYTVKDGKIVREEFFYTAE